MGPEDGQAERADAKHDFAGVKNGSEDGDTSDDSLREAYDRHIKNRNK